MSKLAKVGIDSVYVGMEGDRDSKMGAWEVELSYEGRSLKVPFYMEIGPLGKEPGVVMVLDSLFYDAHLGKLNFGEFCDTVGISYIEDPDIAYHMYDECIDRDIGLGKLFGIDREGIEREVLYY